MSIFDGIWPWSRIRALERELNTMRDHVAFYGRKSRKAGAEIADLRDSNARLSDQNDAKRAEIERLNKQLDSAVLRDPKTGRLMGKGK